MYTLSFEERSEYLYVYIKGDLSQTATKVECWEKIFKRCRLKNFSRLLAVMDGPGNTTEIEAFESARKIVDLGVRDLAIAFVDLDSSVLKNNKFAELVALNRGAVCKVAETEAEAHDWLISSIK